MYFARDEWLTTTVFWIKHAFHRALAHCLPCPSIYTPTRAAKIKGLNGLAIITVTVEGKTPVFVVEARTCTHCWKLCCGCGHIFLTYQWLILVCASLKCVSTETLPSRLCVYECTLYIMCLCVEACFSPQMVSAVLSVGVARLLDAVEIEVSWCGSRFFLPVKCVRKQRISKRIANPCIMAVIHLNM